VDLIVLDWTRMGKVYCLAGVVEQDGQYRVVRPLHVRRHSEDNRMAGWSPYLFDGHTRWQTFRMIDPEPAPPEPPHLEDVWVRELRPTKCLLDRERRRAILRATLTPAGQKAFGVPLSTTRSTVYLPPGQGTRSLASIVVGADQMRFHGYHREGALEPDYRVSLSLPGLDGRYLPVKDHFLLQRAETAAPHIDGRVQALQRFVRDMGEQVVVRIGVTRPFQATPTRGPGMCWLMADGFFSLDDPQP
jgi:hypothetical protein